MWKIVGALFLLAAIGCSNGSHEENLRAGYDYVADAGYYKFYNTKVNWESAQDTCLEEGAQLLIINSEEERIAVSAYMRSQTEYPTTQDMFCGFHDQWTESAYVTVTGIPLRDTGYLTWKSREPSNSLDQNCGAVDLDGYLLDEYCNELKPFICEKQTWTSYELYRELGYYKLYTDGQTWAEAYDACKRDGAHLAVINSQKEADAIFDIFSHNSNLPNVDDPDVAQLGFSMVYDHRAIIDEGRNFITVTGESVSRSGYTLWADEQPKPGVDAYCGAITRFGNLTMSKCGGSNAYFCEHELQD